MEPVESYFSAMHSSQAEAVGKRSLFAILLPLGCTVHEPPWFAALSSEAVDVGTQVQQP